MQKFIDKLDTRNAQAHKYYPRNLVIAVDMSLAKLPNEVIAMIFDHLDSSTLTRVDKALGIRIGSIALYTMRRKTLDYQKQHLRPYCALNRGVRVRTRRYRFVRSPIITCVK